MSFPTSCDTFAVLPSLTKRNVVIFGKNSDRPQNEVQEVVLLRDRPRGSKLKVKPVLLGISTHYLCFDTPVVYRRICDGSGITTMRYILRHMGQNKVAENDNLVPQHL